MALSTSTSPGPNSRTPTFCRIHLNPFTLYSSVVTSRGVTVHGIVAVNVVTAVSQTARVSFEGEETARTLQRLQTAIVQSQRSNVVSQPTDCPTREKRGWLGDAMVTAEEAMYNLDMNSLYSKFLNDMADSQSPDGSLPPYCPSPSVQELDQPHQPHNAMTDPSWTTALPTIADWVYKYYADMQPLTNVYHNIVAHVDYLLAHVDNTTGVVDFFQFGDWCAVQARALATPETGPMLAALSTIGALDATARMAALLGRQEDAHKYATHAAKMRPLAHAAYFNESTGMYGVDLLTAQTLTSSALALDMVPSHLVDSVTERLARDITDRGVHLTVGSYGAKHLLPTLTARHLGGLALQLTTQRSFPSWMHWLDQGATTCWEDWSGVSDATHPPQPTHNHIFLCGGLGEWIHRSVVGVSPLSPGYLRVAYNPVLLGVDKGLTSVSAEYDTIRGTIRTAWALTPCAGCRLALNATVPTTSTGQVHVPQVGSDGVVYESGRVVWSHGRFQRGVDGVTDAHWDAEEAAVVFDVDSGSYAFVVSE